MVDDTCKGTSANVWDLFCYPELRKKTIILLFIWFSISATYFGLSLNSGDLGKHELSPIPSLSPVINSASQFGFLNIGDLIFLASGL